MNDARVRATARALASLGHDVNVICRTAAKELGAPEMEDIGGAKLRRIDFDDVSGLGAQSGLNLLQRIGVRYLSWLRRAFLKRKLPRAARVMALTQEFCAVAPHAHQALGGARFDVVHAIGLPALPSAGWLAKRQNAALVYDSVELEQDRNTQYFGPFHRLRMALERFFIRRADAVATVSPEIAAHLARLYGLQRPTLIQNAAAAEPSPDTIRDVLNAPESTPMAVYIGAAAFGRGLMPSLEMLLEAPEIFLGIVGPPEDRFRLRFQLATDRLGISDRVGMAPARPPVEAASFVSSANVAIALLEPVCLSYAYALPNKLFQAVQAGLPIVVGRTPTLARLVMTYNIGESVDERDSVAVAAAVRRQAARHGTGDYRAARALFLADYDENAAISAWARLYAGLVQTIGDSRHRPAPEGTTESHKH